MAGPSEAPNAGDLRRSGGAALEPLFSPGFLPLTARSPFSNKHSSATNSWVSEDKGWRLSVARNVWLNGHNGCRLGLRQDEGL